MSYSVNINEQTYSVSDSDSIAALRNDYEEICRRYNPKYVNIRRVRAEAGEAMHLKVTVNAPTHYLNGEHDTVPKACSSMTFDVCCPLGYPLNAVRVKYPEIHHLASPNVFRTGNACIDHWIPFTSSLLTVMEKILHDIIHDPSVTRYDSPANSDMIDWHKENVAAGRFPTMKAKLLYAPELPGLPPRRTTPVHPGLPPKNTVTPPPMPKKRH